MFEIGEEVEYIGEDRGRYRAVVIYSDQEYTKCHFYSLGKAGDPVGYSYGEYKFKNSLFERIGPPLTTEQKVLNKIKKLDAAYEKRMKEKQDAKKNLAVQNGQPKLQNDGWWSWNTTT